jgi:hypothetical protein
MRQVRQRPLQGTRMNSIIGTEATRQCLELRALCRSRGSGVRRPPPPDTWLAGPTHDPPPPPAVTLRGSPGTGWRQPRAIESPHGWPRAPATPHPFGGGRQSGFRRHRPARRRSNEGVFAPPLGRRSLASAKRVAGRRLGEQATDVVSEQPGDGVRQDRGDRAIRHLH